ncbi:hypothetical protein [Acinetobacter phage vB_AbaS_TCUP2199]|nr:hypothetical protein [Acinetobacter phage vB_AbaS_TCUP2199]
MPEYTLTPIPDMVLYVDGVPAIVPASNIGAAVLNDFYTYLLDPSTGNSVGVTLRYVHPSSSWILPNGEPALFNLGMSDENFFEIITQLKTYSKANYLVKPLGSLWGYLATDAGNFLELKPDELIEIKPQEFVKAGKEVYYISNLDNGLTLNTAMAQLGVFSLPEKKNPLQDYAWGGYVLNETPQDGKHSLWKVTYKTDTSEFFIKRADQVEQTNPLYETDVTAVGLAMDPQNRPQIVYTIAGVSNIYWYDFNLGRYNHMELPDAVNPCISDLNPNSGTEIILGYQVDNSLMYRKYSEGYQTEHTLVSNLANGLKLHQIGYADNEKFQWLLKG